MTRLALLASVLVAPAAAAQGADHLVGRPHAALPGGWAETAGGLIGHSDLTGFRHTLTEHDRHGDADRLFVYARIDAMHGGQHPVSTVLAALVVEAEEIRAGEVATVFGCHLPDGGPSFGDDNRVVAVVGEPALVEAENVYRYGPVRLAWRLDRQAERFVPADPGRVECLDQESAD